MVINHLIQLRLDVEAVDSSTPPPTDRHRTLERSAEDLNRSASNSPNQSAAKATKTLTMRCVYVYVHACVCCVTSYSLLKQQEVPAIQVSLFYFHLQLLKDNVATSDFRSLCQTVCCISSRSRQNGIHYLYLF